MTCKIKITTKNLKFQQNGKFDFLAACHEIKIDEL